MIANVYEDSFTEEAEKLSFDVAYMTEDSETLISKCY